MGNDEGDGNFEKLNKSNTTRVRAFDKFLWGSECNPKKIRTVRISDSKKWAKYCSESIFEHPCCNNMSAKDMAAAVISKDLTDGKVLIDETEYPCHMLLLRAYLKMFREPQYMVNKVVIKNFGISAETFKLVYEWITNVKNTFTAPEIINLYYAAEKFKNSKLVSSCLKCLSEEDQFKRITSFNCFTLACRTQLMSLAETFLPRLSFFFLAIVTTIEFAQLNLLELVLLIASERLTIQSEIEVFYAVILWISVKFNKRICHVDILMKFVKFEFLPPLCLVKLLMSDVEPIISKCITPYILEQVEKALLTQYNNKYPKSGEMISWSPTRFWFIDLHCPYIEQLASGCDTVSFIEYISFLQIVQEICIKNGRNHGEADEDGSFDYLSAEDQNSPRDITDEK